MIIDVFTFLFFSFNPVFFAALTLGIIHGLEPGHGWPVAATYALDRENKWFHGFISSFLLGIGHLISSIFVVGLFFLGKEYFQISQHIEWINVIAGILLIGLGIREYYHGYKNSNTHQHTHLDSNSHGHTHDNMEKQNDKEDTSWFSSIKNNIPFFEDSNSHNFKKDIDKQGLAGIVWAAFILGFVHEEEFEIIALCLGSDLCLELMLVYALAVLSSLVFITMVLIGGYYRYEDKVEKYSKYFPLISAIVLITMGIAFIIGIT